MATQNAKGLTRMQSLARQRENERKAHMHRASEPGHELEDGDLEKVCAFLMDWADRSYSMTGSYQMMEFACSVIKTHANKINLDGITVDKAMAKFWLKRVKDLTEENERLKK